MPTRLTLARTETAVAATPNVVTPNVVTPNVVTPNVVAPNVVTPNVGILIVLGAVLGLWTEAAAAQERAAPSTSEHTEQSAQEDMQGGGMTEERQLDDEAAREHFRVATRYYNEGRFVDAARHFREAYELSGRPELLYNAYVASREAHQSRQAASMLEAYLARAHAPPNRQNLEARLAELQRAIDEEQQQQERLQDAERRAEEEARRARDEARARRQAETAPEAWPWVVLGVGGAAVIAGAITGGVALSDAGSLRADCNANGLCPASANLDERRASAEALALASDVLLFGGGAVAVTGLVLGLIFGLPGADDASSGDEPIDVSLGCTSSGCRGSVRGRF